MKKDKSESASIPSWIGRHPFPPDEKRFVVITRDMELSTLYGFEGTQVECKRFVSTDKLTLSQWTLPPGTHYEPAGQHNFGDELYYILEGDPIAFNPETGDTHQLQAGDTLYTPQGTRHQIFNFTSGVVIAIGVVAPKIWAPDKMGTKVPPVKKPKFYKAWEDSK